MTTTIQRDIENKKAVKIVAKKCVGLSNIFEGTIIKKYAEELASLTSENEIYGWTNHEVHYGVALVSQLHNEHDPDEHVYYIGIEVEHFDNVPVNLECITIPNGRYAVIHKDKNINAGDIYGIWDETWIKEDEGYTYEYFYESIETYSDRVNGRIEQEFEMDLCIPIK